MTKFLIGLGALLWLTTSAYGDTCHPELNPEFPEFISGKIKVPLDHRQRDGEEVEIYWEKFPASTKPSKGPLFILAGGPLPHHLYHGPTSAFWLEGIFDAYDVYMFDYRGFNCSGQIDFHHQLKGHEHLYNMESMARDVLELRDQLLGPDQKVILFGGSFGYMLAAQVMKDFPEMVRAALIGWGDTDGVGLANSLTQLDRVMNETLPASHPGFLANLDRAKQKFKNGELVLYPGTLEEKPLTYERWSVAAWLEFGMSAEKQNELPTLVEAMAHSNTAVGLEVPDKIADYLLHSILHESASEPPTDQSAVLNFYRCKVFFTTASRRQLVTDGLSLHHLNAEALVDYWDQACANYDTLLDQPFSISDEMTPVDIPILAWAGGRDVFDPAVVEAHIMRFGRGVHFKLFPEWSHDIGADPEAGAQELKSLIASFLKSIE